MGLFLNSREAVDQWLDDGPTSVRSKTIHAAALNFIYQGLLTEPEGNLVEFGHRDFVTA